MVGGGVVEQNGRRRGEVVAVARMPIRAGDSGLEGLGVHAETY